MKEQIINEKTIRCECGEIITGNSKSHTEYNLKAHKKSKRHKRNMKLIGESK